MTSLWFKLYKLHETDAYRNRNHLVQPLLNFSIKIWLICYVQTTRVIISLTWSISRARAWAPCIIALICAALLACSFCRFLRNLLQDIIVRINMQEEKEVGIYLYKSYLKNYANLGWQWNLASIAAQNVTIQEVLQLPIGTILLVEEHVPQSHHCRCWHIDYL